MDRISLEGLVENWNASTLKNNLGTKIFYK